MEFNKYVKENLLPIFQEEGFEILEEFKNIIRFESLIMKINIVYNDYDKSNFIEIGKKCETLYPLNDNVVKNIFKSDIHIDQVTPEVFVKNLVSIFKQKEGVEMLRGNIRSLIELIEQQSKDYTDELVQSQILKSAILAWENSDYKSFINCIDKIDIDKLPQSYLLKYKIAKKNI